MISFIDRIFRNSTVRVFVLLGSIAFLVGFGIFGFGRGAPMGSQFDTRFLYIAGRAWLAGLNAYDPDVALQVSAGLPETTRQYDFAYPPQIAPFCLFLGSLPWVQAKRVLIILSLLCLGLIIYFCLQFIKRPKRKWQGQDKAGSDWYIAALIIGNPFVAEVLWMGQTSLIAGAAITGGWYFYRRQQWLASGILMAIATIKPQLCVLAIFWLILERQWRILGVMAGMLLLFCLVPMMISGPLGMVEDWFASIAIYRSQPYNMLGWFGQTRLQNAIYITTNYLTDGNGIKFPNFFPFAVFLTFALWLMRSRLLEDDVFGILLVVSFVFGFGHYYDLAVLVVLLPLFLRHLRDRPQARAIAVILFISMCASIFLPRFLSLPLSVMVALQFRVLILLGGASWLGYMSFRSARRMELILSDSV